MTLKKYTEVAMAMISNENEKVLHETGYKKLQLMQKGLLALIKPKWNATIATKQEDSKALVTVDGEGVDWTNHSEDEDYALMACNSSDSETEREQLNDASIEIKAYSQGLKKVEAQLVAHQQGQLWYEQKIKFMKIDLDDKTDSVFMNKESDLENQPLNDRFAEGMHVVPPPMTGNYMPTGPEIEIDYSQFTYGPKQTQPSESESQSNELYLDLTLDSDDECVVIPTKQTETPSFANQQVKTPRENVKSQCTHSQKPKVDKKELGHGFAVRAVLCIVALKNKGIVDSGCSRHMTGNKAYLDEFQDFNGGPVAFGELSALSTLYLLQYVKKNKVLFTDSECLVLSPEFKLPDENQVLLKIPRQNNMYSFNLENIVPTGGLACLIAKATTDESNKWHRRLGHVNFKNLNKLVKGNLVRGLPSKIFQNDHTCVACQKGKQHKASCKAKAVSSISQTLQLLHMDLFGPTSVRSLNHKTYCLVITDDFSRFSWVFFLRTKDETSAILKDFIRQIENQLNQKVKTIRSDNGTEFKNKEVIEFCGVKGIKREYSNARYRKIIDVGILTMNKTLHKTVCTGQYGLLILHKFSHIATDEKKQFQREEQSLWMTLERLKKQGKELMRKLKLSKEF
ncbi:putative ribonuclease H-like domain-containing protein [Tanacetum coccineum]